MKMEWADLLIIVVWVSLVLASVVAFIWQIYRRGIWGMFKFEPDERYQQFLQRVQRAWSDAAIGAGRRRNERYRRPPLAPVARINHVLRAVLGRADQVIE